MMKAWQKGAIVGGILAYIIYPFPSAEVSVPIGIVIGGFIGRIITNQKTWKKGAITGVVWGLLSYIPYVFCAFSTYCDTNNPPLALKVISFPLYFAGRIFPEGSTHIPMIIGVLIPMIIGAIILSLIFTAVEKYKQLGTSN